MRLVPQDTHLYLLFRSPLSFARRYWGALSVLGVGAVADALSTYEVAHRLGPDAEVHPAQRTVLAVLGVAVGVPCAKAVQVFFVVTVASWWRPWCAWMLTLCGILYMLAAVSNHFGLL